MSEAPQHPSARDRYVGCLLGQAIGDALGFSIEGQYSASTELAMCLAEGLVTSNGFVDPELVGERFLRVLHSEHAGLLDPATRLALEHAEASGNFQAGCPESDANSPGPAVRVTPVALVHALSDLNPEVFVREVMRSTLMTSANPDAVNGALASAYATRVVLRREVPPELLMDEVLAFIDEDVVAQTIRKAKRLFELTGGTASVEVLIDDIGAPETMETVVATALYLFCTQPDDYRAALGAATSLDGTPDAVGALVGAFSGAHLGAEAIPTDLVDQLEGRMYVLMAAPAILRVAQMRAGLFYHLHQT